MTIEALSAPFPVEAVKWRAQTLTRNKENPKALALAYIDARDVMDRLDAVVGPANWATTYEETAKGRMMCRLSLRIEREWVMKTDGAGNTDVEGDKGAISDALKRAAVTWGVGRYLYDLADVWAPCILREDGKWQAWKPEAAKVFADALKKVGRPTGPITDTTRDWLGAQLQSIGKGPADLLKHLAPQDLRDLTYEQLPAIQQFINANKKAA
jgi:hypothetical protein